MLMLSFYTKFSRKKLLTLLKVTQLFIVSEMVFSWFIELHFIPTEMKALCFLFFFSFCFLIFFFFFHIWRICLHEIYQLKMIWRWFVWDKMICEKSLSSKYLSLVQYPSSSIKIKKQAKTNKQKLKLMTYINKPISFPLFFLPTILLSANSKQRNGTNVLIPTDKNKTKKQKKTKKKKTC